MLGDVHGDYNKFAQIANRTIYDHRYLIQVGDLGVGFPTTHGRFTEYDGAYAYRFIRGNHDNPTSCRLHRNWIKDGTLETLPSGKRILFVGGAWSIDAQYRTPGLTWWEDEQCSYAELNDFLTLAMATRPDVVITHDGPPQVIPTMFNKELWGSNKTMEFNRNLLDLAPPKLWVFGHWHETRDVQIGPTRFVCLGELQAMDFDL